MARQPRWQDPEGLNTINTIVKKLVPNWTNGLHAVQLELVSAILDGKDLLCCTATGEGKSAAFSIPTLVLLEYNKHPNAYVAGLPTRKRPIGVVVTPTKGLADNIVHELLKLNISGFSYCKETLSEARKAGIRLAGEIKECVKWQVICVDPEHLRDKEWREITEHPIFRANILFACVDEVHLINEWGLAFRLAFGTIGTFLRGRFPASVSIVGLTATLEPGRPTVSVCKSLGFFEGNFVLIRRSNERPNTQFTVQFLTHGLNGDKFPDILPYLASGRKTIIHCRTVNQVSQVFAYIWRMQPEGTNKLIRARVYHSICPADYNRQTIELLETEPRLQIVISTVAFSNGLNAKSLLDSLSLGFGSTFNESWQEKGRVGRDPNTIGRGVILAHHSVIKEARSFLASVSSPVQLNNRSKKRTKTPRVLDRCKALVITEKSCYIACINTCYANPSLDPSCPDLSRLDCVAAGRQLPCSLCLPRLGNRALVFPPSPLPVGSAPLPILTAPRTSHRFPATPKKDKLRKTEREAAQKHLLNFGESIRQIERKSDAHKYRPRSSYFPSRVLSLILDKLLVIHFPSELDQILNGSWFYHSSHRNALFDSIIEIQISITVQRNTSGNQHKKQRLAEATDDEDTDIEGLSNVEFREQTAEDAPEQSLEPCVPPLGRKRQALEEATNTTKRLRAPRAPQPSVAEVQESFGPQYRTRRSVIIAEASSSNNSEKENRMVTRSRKK